MSRKTVLNLSFLLRSHVLQHSTVLQAKQCHAQIILQGLLPNVTLENDLLLAYSRFSLYRDARKVFDTMLKRNMHSWNIMIASLIGNSMYNDVLTIFSEFKSCGFRPDHYTLPQLFKASIGLCNVCFGKICHGWVIRLGYEGYVVVGSSVLEFYVKCGAMPEARSVFSSMLCKDSVVWNLMISGFGKAGLYSEAIGCLREMMIRNGVKVDDMIVPSILNACGRVGDLMKGKEVHGYVVKNFVSDADVPIGNALIDMYGKCGCLNHSEKVFRTLHRANLVTWTTMISCYGIHGKGEESLLLFKKMIDDGFTPNSVTVTAILASCSHSALIDQGKHIFRSIYSDYGLEPTSENYACMVYLLGRCGYLMEALQLLKSMKKSSVIGSIWGALLAGCVMHKNVEIGEIAAHHLFQLEPNNASNYIALGGIYQSHGMLEGISNVRAKMRDLGLVKSPGYSWINIAGKSHKFYQGDLSHPLAQMIYNIIYQISDTQLLTNYLGEGNLLHDDTLFMGL